MDIDHGSRSAGRYFGVIHRFARRHFASQMQRLGLPPAAFPLILRLLWEDNISQDELADDFLVDKGTVARTLVKLEEARKMFVEGVINVLVVTQSRLDGINDSVKELRDKGEEKRADALQKFMASVRFVVIPDIDKDKEIRDNGWFFNREIEATALLLSAVTPDVIKQEGVGNAADDLQRFINQITSC